MTAAEYRALVAAEGKRGPARTPWEQREQEALVELLRLAGICHAAIPNETASRAEAGKAKARGAQRGFPDLLIFDPPPGIDASPSHPESSQVVTSSRLVVTPPAHGVAVEMKRADGRPSDVRPEQRDWLDRLDSRGWVALVAFGCEHAVEELRRLGYTIGGAR